MKVPLRHDVYPSDLLVEPVEVPVDEVLEPVAVVAQ